MDLARAILFALEKCEKPWGMHEFEIEGATAEQISYHVKLLHQAGLIEAHDASSLNQFKWYPSSLTWAGHEFLDAARDNSRWNRAKKIAADKGGHLTFEVLRELLLQLMRQTIHI
jgi:hypothetical protein